MNTVINFSEGAFEVPTHINLASFPLNHLYLYGYHLLDRGISVSVGSKRSQFYNYAMIKMTYDSEVLSNKKNISEMALTINKVHHYSCAYERLESIGSAPLMTFFIESPVQYCAAGFA